MSTGWGTAPGSPGLTLRREEPHDHRAAEQVTHEAFWGMSGPGCEEHLLVHRLREAECFVPELDLVAEMGGLLARRVMYSRAAVVGERARWGVGRRDVRPRERGPQRPRDRGQT